jgi:superfamily II DNA/RNA helicase
LEKVLKQYQGSVLIFARTKHNVKRLAESIKLMGHKVAEIHSNRSLGQRREALAGFKAHNYRILVATDIAARGIDVSNIELVINYDLPEKSNDYVHRIGRTARAGKKGKAISFATPAQGKEIKGIERLINKDLAKTKFAELATATVYSSYKRRGGFGARPVMPKRPAGGYSKFKPVRIEAPTSHKQNAPRHQRSSYNFLSTDKQKYRASVRLPRNR